MNGHQDFDELAGRDRRHDEHHRQARVEVAGANDGESWPLHVALVAALVVAMMFSTFF